MQPQDLDLSSAGVAPLSALQAVLDRVVELLKQLGIDQRAEIEAWADSAVAQIAAMVKRPLLRAAILFIGPRLVDLALDSVFGDDGDNT